MALKESKKLEQANSYELVVTVDGETFEKALNTVYKKEVKKINIPGFRKGKAPRHIIEKMYGKEVFYDDAMQDCYPEALYNAAEEAGVKDKDWVSIKLEGERALVFDKVLIRASNKFKAECHLDTDEGNAAGCGPDAVCEIVKIW